MSRKCPKCVEGNGGREKPHDLAATGSHFITTKEITCRVKPILQMAEQRDGRIWMLDGFIGLLNQSTLTSPYVGACF